MSTHELSHKQAKPLHEIKLSVLDLVPILEGGSPNSSFRHSLDLARHVEALGYNRYWLAEHHNMAAIGSSATSVVIGYIAGGTSKIRVGSGGIMLPNHAPLVIAEQFGTLESMYPGRIDLGLGRAPGSDQRTAGALRRNLHSSGDDFPELLSELRGYFDPARSVNPQVHAFPGEGLDVPIWLLGSSGYSAQLAGQLGLPFGFAGHFSPDYTLQAMELYHRSFRASDMLQEPYALVCLNVIVAETDEEAQRLATSQQQAFLNLIRGTIKPLKPPVDSMDGIWTPYEKEVMERQGRASILGSKETVRSKLQAFLNETKADELMINAQIYDHEARLNSYRWLAELVQKEPIAGE
ncbi:LLM class flavin-dependent oxidoreductase [Paenibacillus koleovorans]|uniref:LLM class flavin-dependent oxidoreductase n=1 Tax=Paenibacillus koleovorans TaxID=121608 RepID=UPI000FD778AC|nr:LLM class flavin-dependent oxidoreductase [Paenibacillus koleovorans]